MDTPAFARTYPFKVQSSNFSLFFITASPSLRSA